MKMKVQTRVRSQQIIIISTAAILLLDQINKQRRKSRRWWVRPIYQNRFNQGDYNNLLQEMRLQDSEMFFNYTRMDIQSFDKLLALVGPLITKQSNRPAIPAASRLALTLRLLAAGDSLQSTAFAYRMGRSTVCEIFRETCQKIWTVLQPRYLNPPSEDEWRTIAEEFSSRWQFPNCLGALDGKHVAIRSPNKSGSIFFNYKKHFSIILFAVCDANYLFTSVDVGAYGSQSDGGVLKESNFGKNLMNGKLSIPSDSPLPCTTSPVPYFFVGDEAFPLQKTILRPYSGRYLDEDRRIFNYRLSRARRCIENAFGILVGRWRIYHKTIHAYPENIDHIIKATLCLHNYIKMEEKNIPGHMRRYCNSNYIDREMDSGEIRLGAWREQVPEDSALQSVTALQRRIGSRNARADAVEFRNYVKEYVTGTGRVDWQLGHVNAL